MSKNREIDLLQRVVDHLRKHTPKEHLDVWINERLKREGKPNGGDVPRLLIDLELEILNLQRQ